MSRFFLSAAAGLLTFVVAVAAADQPQLPEGPGKAATEKLCGKTCHGSSILLNKRESREGWSGIVEDMIRRGARGEDDEFGEVVDYLTEHLSKNSRINMNQASARLMTSSLGFPAAQAEAVVEYRTAKGPFKTIEDLLKVPGLDASLVESKKARITF
jgi:competence ComEA-like helix-hairpin-helix protein